jgi:proteasome accessory factor A
MDGYRTRDGIGWSHPRLQLVDLQYSDVRADRGLYNKLVAAGRMERLLDEPDVRAAVTNPPEDTRAYFRGRCLQQYPDSVAAASWDSVIFDIPGRGRCSESRPRASPGPRRPMSAPARPLRDGRRARHRALTGK